MKDKLFILTEINTTKAEKWWNRLRQYEKEHLSKKYKDTKYETFEEWILKVYEAKKQK